MSVEIVKIIKDGKVTYTVKDGTVNAIREQANYGKVNDEQYCDMMSKYTFELFKTAKHIINGQCEYDCLETDNDEDICKISENGTKKIIPIIRIFFIKGKTRPIEIVGDPNVKMRQKCCSGFFHADHEVKMVIVNCEEIETDFLDESRVKGLLIGSKTEKIQDDCLCQSLRYIYVKSDNKFFRSENNVLYSKDMKKLYAYAAENPNEEYRIDEITKELAPLSFSNAPYLKRLILPKNIKIHGIHAIEKHIQLIYY